MKKIVLGASLALTAGIGIAGDNNYDDRWYVTPNVSFVKPDNAKGVGSDLELGIALGKFITEKKSLDLEVGRGSYNYNSGGENLQLRSMSIIGRHHFTEKQGYRPFVGLGLGAMSNSTKFTSNSKREAVALLVAGLSKTISEKWKLKTEFRFRIENSDDTFSGENRFNDKIINTGLSYALGETSAPTTKTDLVEQAPQLDGDNDGVSDADDRCPNSPAGAKVDASGCTIVNIDGDDDNDGVANSKDACPNSRPGAVVGSDGCEVKVVIELQGVHFDTDKSTLKPESIDILNAAVKTLGEHGSIMVEVAGHTDSRASDAYNQALSQRRAEVVYKYLVAHGVADSRMTWKGYGESQPIATNDTEEGMAKNRRTELIVK